MNITIYTLPNCVQCDTTKRYLDRHNVAYETVDLSQDESAMEKVKALGYSSAPVVTVGDRHWSGFKLDLINGVIKEVNAEQAKAS